MASEKPSPLLRLARCNKRHAIAVFAVIFIICVSMFTFVRPGSCGGRTIRSFNEAVAFSRAATEHQEPIFVDLNKVEASANPKANQEHVLILTPLKNAASYLPRYFELLDRMTYPKHLISIAFLVSDTTDNTVELLQEQANMFLNRWRDRYHDITIYQKDFNFELPEDQRHKFELQPLRRSFMARARNYLLTAALRDEHAWVLWLDADLVEYPATILEDLMSVDVDVVVPNCLRETEDGSFWGYDKNNWQETDQSIEMQKDLDPVSFSFLSGLQLVLMANLKCLLLLLLFSGLCLAGR